MKAIVAVDKKWGIGKKNDLLFSLPEDMAFFRKTTLNKVCCMGYNTLLSFPGSKPLKNRTSIVLAPQGVVRDDCTIVYSLEELSKELEKYNKDDIFVIGGAMFGDNLSMISDTTIAACNTQGCEMKDKFKQNFFIVLPAAIITAILFFVVTMNLESTAQSVIGENTVDD